MFLRELFKPSKIFPEDPFPSVEMDYMPLSFRGDLETQFLEDYYQSSIGLLRLSILLGMVFYGAFFLLDLLVLPELVWQLAAIRFFLVIPIVFLIFVFSFSDHFQNWWQLAASIATVVSGIGIILMTTLPAEVARASYYGGIFLVLMYCYMLIRLRFIWATLSGWTIVILYALSLVMMPGLNNQIISPNLFFVVSANILGMFGGYALEFYTRKDFYNRNLQDEERRKGEQENALLEDRAEEQTLDLKRSLKNLRALQRIDRAITSSLDLKESLGIFLTHVIDRLGVDAAAVFLYKEELQGLTYAGSRGLRKKIQKDEYLRLGEGLTGQVALERKEIFIPDLKKAGEHPLFSSRLEGEDIKFYCGLALETRGELVGVLEVLHRFSMHPGERWKEFAVTLARQAAIALDRVNRVNELQRTNMKLQMAYNSTIEGWARTLELRDVETEGHSRRVVNLAAQIAQKLGMDEEDIVHLKRGALLHDIGKMSIPDGILFKPGVLSDEEWEIMRGHPLKAVELLEEIQILKPALDIPHYHHERWDGSGYPHGLEGEEIPLPARVFAVVDVWDALRSDRPYRDAWSDEKALAHIKEKSGQLFDPRVVGAFLEVVAN